MDLSLFFLTSDYVLCFPPFGSRVSKLRCIVMVCGISASIRFSAANLLLMSWFDQENESTITAVVGF